MSAGEKSSPATGQSPAPDGARLVRKVCEAVDFEAPHERVIRELVNCLATELAPRIVSLQTARSLAPELIGVEVSGDWAGPEPTMLGLTEDEARRVELDDGAYAPVSAPAPLARDAVASFRAPLACPELSGLLALEWMEPPPEPDADRALVDLLAGVLSGLLSAHRHHRAMLQGLGLAEAAVRQTEALLCVLDREARVTFFNPALERLTGYRGGEVAGVPFGQWLCLGGDESLAKVILDTLAGRPSRAFEARLPLKPGGCATALITAAPVYDEDHAIEGVALVGLGQHHVADLSARQDARMARLRQLSTGVATKLKKPAAELGLQLAQLQSVAAEAGPDAVQAVAEATRIGAGLARLAAELEVLAGSRDEEPSAISVNQVVEGALEDAAAMLSERGIRIRTALAGELPDMLGMPRRLRRAVSNLLANACEAGGRRITLRTWDNRDGTIGFSVADNGAGIPEEHLPRVLAPFYTVDAESGSVGLGLAVVQDAVDVHHGTVDIDSGEGEGTVVTITLPVRRAGRAEEVPGEA